MAGCQFMLPDMSGTISFRLNTSLNVDQLKRRIHVFKHEDFYIFYLVCPLDTYCHMKFVKGCTIVIKDSMLNNLKYDNDNLLMSIWPFQLISELNCCCQERAFVVLHWNKS